MKRSELEKHIGESVEVKLFDGDTMQGVLRKTGTEEVRNNPNLYLKGGYYFLSHKDTYVCKSCLFRVSHIKSLTVSGDTWDIVAYKAYGNEMYMDTLIKANIEYKDTYIFPAGVVLTLPEIELTVSESLPPWKQGVTISE